MKYIKIFVFFILLSCSAKPNQVYICGDHACKNKNEMRDYFKNNISIEVYTITSDKEKKEGLDLVELNLLKENLKSEDKVNKTLGSNKSKENIKKILDQRKKLAKLKMKKDEKPKQSIINKTKGITKTKEIKEIKKNTKSEITKEEKKIKPVTFVRLCKNLQECDIDQISKIIIDMSKDKPFPDITSRWFMKNKNYNIAIVGLGNIGLYLYEYLIKNKKKINKKTNVTLNIKYVSAKSRSKKRRIKISKNKWLKNYLQASKMKDVDIVVELIGGSEGAAKKLVFNSLKNGKHVVTANKSLISKYGDQLSKLAEKNKVNLEFEAAVAGGVPIIRSLKEGLLANKINKVYGILNGTSNYILSNMRNMNMDFKMVLDKAKKMGYAENNPASDLNGDDVKSKILILSALAFNSFINKKKIEVEGINNVDQIDIKNSEILGYKIKHLGVSELENDKLIQRIHPCLIKKESYISNVNDVFNAIIVEGKPVGKFVIQGEGAGPGATTSALVSDICSILRGNIKFPFSISYFNRKKIDTLDVSNKIFSYYIRLDVLDKKGVLSSITKIMSKNKISVKRLIQNPFKGKKFASIVIVSHKSKNRNIIRCMRQLSRKSFIINKPKFIRIEEFWKN